MGYCLCGSWVIGCDGEERDGGILRGGEGYVALLYVGVEVNAHWKLIEYTCTGIIFNKFPMHLMYF